MRKVSLLTAAAVGALAGWRAARSGAAGLLLPPRAAGGPTGLLDAARSKEAPVVLEKVVALFDLGRERGLELLQGAFRRGGPGA